MRRALDMTRTAHASAELRQDPAAAFLVALGELAASEPRRKEATDPATTLPEVLTVCEAARFLGVNRKTVYDSIAIGDLPARRVGRGRRRLVIGREALLTWLARAA